MATPISLMLCTIGFTLKYSRYILLICVLLLTLPKMPNATETIEEILKKFELVKANKLKKSVNKNDRAEEDPPRKRYPFTLDLKVVAKPTRCADSEKRKHQKMSSKRSSK